MEVVIRYTLNNKPISCSIIVTDDDPETYDPSVLPKEVLAVVEADSFWCLSKLLDGIQVI